MTTAALILAAGRGSRAGGERPKQWQTIAGRRVIDWTVDAFLSAPEIALIIVVLHPDDLDLFIPPPRVEIATGGDTRADSVRCGLEYLAKKADMTDGFVLIHDVARCCIKPAHISLIASRIKLSEVAGVAPALAVTDALWSGANGQVTGSRNREGLYRAQTPQAFDFARIRAAHLAHAGAALDDVEVASAAGMAVEILEGDEDNFKITYPSDFTRAERILNKNMDIRVGSGFDVHRFGSGGACMICGVAVPHDRGLLGHSDADVGMHALTDALYGSLAEGDIGRHFPPSDPQWKGAESHIFLRHAISLVSEKGFKINNMDITLICEQPKITPHALAMRMRLSAITGVDVERISIKATTSERLGFTGREEGIAAQATVTLVKTCD